MQHNGNFSPINGKPLSSNKFIPNLAIKTQIDEYNQKKLKEEKVKFSKSFISVSSNINPNANIIQLLLLGDCNVGKTSIKRYIEFGDMNSKHIQPTIGIEMCHVKFIQDTQDKNNDNDTIIRITDICGQDRFRSLTRQCYRNIHGVILICSLDCPQSVSSLKTKWSDDTFQYAPDHLYGIVIVNKCDLLSSSSSSNENLQYESLIRQAISFANYVGFPVYCTSCVTGEYIHTAFTDIVKRIKSDILIWDSIQYSHHSSHDNNSTSISLTNLQESCSTNGCMFVLNGFSSFAGKSYDKIKNKLND